MTAFAIRNARLDGRAVDVTIADDRIVAIGPPGTAGADGIDADGGTVLPGLHDHHIHLMALAAARVSVDVSPAAVRDADGFARALQSGARAVGYHESVAGPLDRWRLDAVVGDRPVRVQHRTGALWVLSSAALRLLPAAVLARPGVGRDASGRPTGEFYGLDATLRERFGDPVPDVAAVARELVSYGVTGVTDLTPSERAAELDALAAVATAPAFPLRVIVTGAATLDPGAAPGLPRGPVKVVIADHRLPSIDELAAAFRDARSQRRTVAVHCVTRVALLLALAAWDEVGAVPGDRIEHGAVVPLELVPDIRDRGITVVTQPSFVHERGDDYLRDVEPADQPDLWRCASLVAGGVPVGGSTDAPYGSADPWAAMRAAVERRTTSGAVLGPGERLDAHAALDLFLTDPHDPGGEPRTVAIGAAADLCVLRGSLDPGLRHVEVRGIHGRAGWVDCT